MAWEYQFVDSVSASATVRLDLQSDWFVTSETAFPPPELRRSAVSTLLADGERYPAAAYSNRFLRLVLTARSSDPDAVASALQTLYRELDRPAGILRYRPGTSEAVFFRTFRAGPDSVQWSAALRQVTAVVPAEPFAYGERQTLSSVTVANDPAAASNGMFFDVTGVRGDVETPLFLSFDGALVASTSKDMLLAVRRRGTPASAPFVLQAESMSAFAGGDTALAAANDPVMSGAGANYMRTTFATKTTMTTRVSTSPFPPAAGVDVRGQYRVFARVRVSDATDQFRVQLWYGPTNPLIQNDAVTATAALGPRYLDLGLIQWPIGADPVTDGYSGEEIPTQGTGLQVAVERTSGTGTFDLDLLLFVPADDCLAVVSWDGGSTVTAAVLDSARTMAYYTGASGQIVTSSPIPITGRLPMVSPGVTNRITVMQTLGLSDSLTSTATVTPYYWPRYLHVRPVGA